MAGTITVTTDRAWVDPIVMSNDAATISVTGQLVNANAIPAPTGLMLQVISSSQINLSWNAVESASSYVVRRGGVQIATPAGTAYSNTGLSPSTTYYYTVAAVVGGLEGAQSGSVNATTENDIVDPPYSPSTWGGVILTEAQHRSVISGTNNPHFASDFADPTAGGGIWYPSGGWNGEGYMRWRVAYSTPEDDDGYGIGHPLTASRGIYLSFVGRIGPTWWQHHLSGDRFKFVIFYPQAGTNPRPTIFNMPIFAGDGGAYSYRTWGPDLEAGGSGFDEFGTGPFDWDDNYPNHQYKENSTASDWRFYVMALMTDRTQVYLWNRSGPIIGAEAASIGQTFYARSAQANSTILNSWDAQSWNLVRLLAYIEATTAGDANSYMDIGRIKVTQTLPNPPAGFVTG